MQALVLGARPLLGEPLVAVPALCAEITHRLNQGGQTKKNTQKTTCKNPPKKTPKKTPKKRVFLSKLQGFEPKK